jgi:hypothetical protein
VDDGALAREDGRWVARGDLSRVGAPETVHAVIAARLDRLDPADRDVLAARFGGRRGVLVGSGGRPVIRGSGDGRGSKPPDPGSKGPLSGPTPPRSSARTASASATS